MNRYIPLFFLFILLCTGAARAYNMFDLQYGLLDVRSRSEGRIINGLFEKLNFVGGRYYSISYQVPFTRHSYFGIGIGFTQLSFQKEIEGVFPETGQYGSIVADGTTGYWTFPLSFTCFNVPHRDLDRGFRISYVPCFEGSNSARVSRYGGASQSVYASQYSNEEQSFQHSLIFSLVNQLSICRGHIRFSADPYAGIGSGFFKNEKAMVNALSLGISFHFQFKVPEISVEWGHYNTQRNEEKRKRLEEKQKQIEQQLQNKPK